MHTLVLVCLKLVTSAQIQLVLNTLSENINASISSLSPRYGHLLDNMGDNFQSNLS